MGCIHGREIKTSPKSKYDLIIEDDKDCYLNIYQENDVYFISGTLSPDVKKFFLIFKKEDEERLPVAISFELSDENFISNQYQFLKFCPSLSLHDLDNVIVQFPDDELSGIYSCDVSPSFPFAVDIKGSIKLKTLSE
jgi:hypothetical protein